MAGTRSFPRWKRPDRMAVARWCANAAFLLPIIVLYGAHYASSLAHPGTVPTGFIQYDQAYYMSNARELVEAHSLGPGYPLPFSSDRSNPAIYFQPQIWLLGQLWRLTGLDPGTLFVLFGAVFGLLAVDVFRRVFDAFVPDAGRWRLPGQVLFIWGGGVLCLAGALVSGVHGRTAAEVVRNVFALDPGYGWWFLDLGRNLAYPLEAYYHFLFFSVLLLLVRRRWGAALSVVALLAISHPFTGMACLLIVLTWAVVEQWYVRTHPLPSFFVPVLVAVLAGCGLYYGVWMGRDPEHRQLMTQWTLEWLVQAENFVPAYLLVGVMAFLRLRSPARLKAFLRAPERRFLLLWAAANFAFENHEFAVTAHQPLHFTRGYTWSALFLIGAPWLIGEAVPWLLARRTWVRVPLIAGGAALFLSDNITWTVGNSYLQYQGYTGIHITVDQRATLEALDRSGAEQVPLVCQDEGLAYLATVYTGFRPYVSHVFNTPDIARKRAAAAAYFAGRITDPVLEGRTIAVVDRRDTTARPPGRIRPLHEDPSYRVLAVGE